jgi:hypothetical protein
MPYDSLAYVTAAALLGPALIYLTAVFLTIRKIG